MKLRFPFSGKPLDRDITNHIAGCLFAGEHFRDFNVKGKKGHLALRVFEIQAFLKIFADQIVMIIAMSRKNKRLYGCN